MHPVFRSVASIWAALFAALFGYITMTVPMIAAAAPAIITIALVVLAFFLWPRGDVWARSSSTSS